MLAQQKPGVNWHWFDTTLKIKKNYNIQYLHLKYIMLFKLLNDVKKIIIVNTMFFFIYLCTLQKTIFIILMFYIQDDVKLEGRKQFDSRH